MKKALLALLYATVIAHAAFALEATSPEAAPACTNSVQSMKAQAPEATYTMYKGDEGKKVRDAFVALAVKQGYPAEKFADVDGILTATLPQEEEKTFVALLKGDCVFAYTVAPSNAVKELIEKANGQGI